MAERRDITGYGSSDRTGSARDFRKTRRNRKLGRLLLFGVAFAVCAFVMIGGIFFLSNLLSTETSNAPSPGEASSAPPSSPSSGSTEATDLSVEKTTKENGASEERELVAAESCDALDILVDPNHALPPGYEPQDLAYISGYGVALSGEDLLLRREAGMHLGDLSNAAIAAGEEVLASSAYRSYTEQEQTFAHFTGIYGDWATHVSAPPGQSQHQLGTTVDFTNSEVGYQLIPTFGDTSASYWLTENSWRYGFINTYPAEDTTGTGRQAEAWEYRYVGVERAKEMESSGLSLRRYLTRNGQAPCIR